MKLKFPLIAAFAAMLALTACGGGDSAGTNIPVSSPATLVKTDNVVGTGAEAVTGKTLTLNYTLWLYKAEASDFKGTQLESNPYTLKLGTTNVIQGFAQGVTGMKVGGKRTVLVPSSLAYGPTGGNGIPPNSGLVFEITLNKVE
ncbi:FKBP-type peptidyl-prolyl cis-trans isomerase [Massilia sp. ZL223]|uniref:FKBP-type peptidyl-prolyl cis-trans isomerase n=1 Tax=Massilia sp. ZL223 TaxID=2824904 RepID=UPI001B8285A6|nr:FKBP-type peptidyl-prolyl cis-trans isomerase [Massilia sp. ZL223]MBQ5962322.1 FKBP-type peptidyl-prolyl cis-trans isomerase [Massilia sp. ZL223]